MSDDHKRKLLHDTAKRLEKEFVDKGLLIEAGWVALRTLSVPENAPQIQLDEMRTAFFAGAQHLFSSIMSIMDEDAEPTADDMRRLDLINKELETFIAEYNLKHGVVRGRA